MIHHRYNDDEGFHQAKVLLLPMPPMTDLRKIRNRKTGNGMPTAAQKLVSFVFDGEMERGRIYSAQEFYDVCGITEKQFGHIMERHKAIAEYMGRIRLKQGQYKLP